MMALPYDEAVKVWASRKFDLALDDIISVRFDIFVSGSCPTCGPDVDAEVWVHLANKPAFITNVDTSDLGSLIREVLEAAHPDV